MQIILNFKKKHFLILGLIIAVPFLFIAITNIFAATPGGQYHDVSEIVGLITNTLQAADGSPTNAVYVDDTGNVGIGTTTPQAKLDVAGGIRVVDGTQGTGKLLTSDANGVASWQAPVSTGIPSGFCVFSDTQSTCPAGWTRRTQFDGRTIKGSATPGGTGGANTHSHGSYIDQDTGGSYWQGSSTNAGATNWPPYTEVLICCKN